LPDRRIGDGLRQRRDMFFWVMMPCAPAGDDRTAATPKLTRCLEIDDMRRLPVYSCIGRPPYTALRPLVPRSVADVAGKQTIRAAGKANDAATLPLWVKSGHSAHSVQCPLPPKAHIGSSVSAAIGSTAV
jgi:hypothetical protein